MTNEGSSKLFDEKIMDIYRRALSEARYRATIFHQMLLAHRGLETARILLRTKTVSDGYTALWERGRLDLTVEAVINDDPHGTRCFLRMSFRYAPSV